MEETQSRWKKIKRSLAKAFIIEEDDSWEPSDSQKAIVEKLVKWVTRRRLTLPAVMTLESMTPLNFLSSQVMVFFQPFVSAFLDTKEYMEFQNMLEHRQSIQYMVNILEEHEEAYIARQKSTEKEAAAPKDKE